MIYLNFDIYYNDYENLYYRDIHTIPSYRKTFKLHIFMHQKKKMCAEYEKCDIL